MLPYCSVKNHVDSFKIGGLIQWGGRALITIGNTEKQERRITI
jgi:hypothetical protein